MIEWKEEYAPKGKPVWTYYAQIGRFRLVVTRHSHLLPTEWRLSLEPGVIDSVLGGDVSPEVAKTKCEDLFRTMLTQALAELTPPMKRKKAKP